MKAPDFDLPGVDGKRHSPASAQCTPELYGFDAALELRYHGRIDELASVGCSIKWKK